jgi:hypothetical protein
MEILFVWIDNFRSIRHQGLNTSAEFRFDYSLSNASITITKNENYIKEYFGNNVKNITAIVGENGTGKTSILDFFKDKLGQGSDFKQKLILIYKNESEGNTLKIVAHNVDKSKLKIINQCDCSYSVESIRNFKLNNTKDILTKKEDNNIGAIPSNKSITEPKSILQSIPGFNKSIIIFYSNIFDYREETDSQFVYNISTNRILVEEWERFRIHEIRTQIDFVIQSKHISNLDILLPNVVIASFKSRPASWLGVGYKRRTDNIEGKQRSRNIIIDIYEYIKFIYSKISKIRKTSRNEKLRDVLALALYHNFLIELSETASLTHFTSLIHAEIDESKLIRIISIDYFLSALSRFSQLTKSDDYEPNFDNQEIIVNLKRVIEILYKKEIQFYNDYNSSNVRFELPLLDDSSTDTRLFFESYAGAFRSRGILDFNWQDMSSGEKARLAFLARLHSLKSDSTFKKHGKHKNIILLIDEGEQYFHPQWQKEYIKFLISNITVVIPNVTYQIILTSHSPFILSDLTRENIIYLAKDKSRKVKVINNSEKERTLAANIHTLFRDAYFMKDGLIGNYAQDKMDEILAPLVNKTMDKNHAILVLKFINNIGEPILRNRLMALYNEQVQGE